MINFDFFDKYQLVKSFPHNFYKLYLLVEGMMFAAREDKQGA